MTITISRRELVADDHLPNDLPTIIKQIYASRGVISATELDHQVANLQGLSADSAQLKGLTQACEVLLLAIDNNSAIVIVGDFDADGATSTALMMSALSMFGSKNHSFIVPNRFKYGYGLTPEIVDIAAAQEAQVLVTVDNGISCIAGVNRAKELGLQVVVTDHHLPGKITPNADAIVNPNQHGCQFASKALAGVGVAFYLMLALRKHCREQSYLTKHAIPEPNIAPVY